MWNDPETAAQLRGRMAEANPPSRRSANGKTAWPKQAATKSRKGTNRDSRGERELALVLCSVYGDGEVVRNTLVLGHHVDAHIRSINVCIEFDGVYWHGLDRPYDQLTPHIRRKFDRDRAADRTFAGSAYRLVRVTDMQWREMSTEARVAWAESLVTRAG